MTVSQYGHAPRGIKTELKLNKLHIACAGKTSMHVMVGNWLLNALQLRALCHDISSEYE